MAQLRIVSWNVETFGENKIQSSVEFMTAVLNRYQVDIVCFMETTKSHQAMFLSYLAPSLEALTTDGWHVLASDWVAKLKELPPTIPFKPWSKSLDFNAYAKVFLNCYAANNKTQQFELLPAAQQKNVSEVIESLYLASLIKVDYESYTALMRYNKAYLELHNRYVVPSTLPSQPWGLSPRVELVSTNAQGVELGYQDPLSTFNGRMPVMYSLARYNPGAPNQPPNTIPLAQIHAPYGDHIGPRVPAARNMMLLATRNPANPHQLTALKNRTPAVVAGDFNIDYKYPNDYGSQPKPVPNNKPADVQAYATYLQEGFAILINEKTSLITVEAANKLSNNPPWKEYRSSGYDNFMVKSLPGSPPPVGQVLDLIKDIKDESGPLGYLHNVADIPQPVQTRKQAFNYYRTKVSDHLPVMLTLTVG